jgi:hypothetical protein
MIDVEYPMPIDLPYPMPYMSELEMFVNSNCQSSATAMMNCGIHENTRVLLDSKLPTIKKLISESEKPLELRQLVSQMLEQKFYELTTSKAKFVAAYVWLHIQDDFSPDSIDTWIKDSISWTTKGAKISSISELPWDNTIINGNTIQTQWGAFYLSVNTADPIWNPVWYNERYEMLAVFGDLENDQWGNLDRNQISYAGYNESTQTWEFQDLRQTISKVDTVSIYLICEFCKGETFHRDRWTKRIADSKTFTYSNIW